MTLSREAASCECAEPSTDAVLAFNDGRELCYRIYGAPDGRPVLALHGTPGSRYKYAAAGEIAQGLGIRLISLDRWGYGRTSIHPEPSLTAFAHDCDALLDHLKIERAGVVGISGGGPFAVGTAAVLGDRIGRLALVAPVGPIRDAGLGLRELGPLHFAAFRILARLPGAGRVLFAPFRQLALRLPSASARVATLRAGPPDRRLMRDRNVRRALGTVFAEGLQRSTRGAAIDLEIFGRRWDADPGRVTASTKIWIGRQDRNVPIAAVLELARRLPASKLNVQANAGHFWIVNNFENVLNWLVANTGERVSEPPGEL